MKRNVFTFLILLVFLVLASGISANNILVTNISLTGGNITDNYVMVQFDLSWENSWRTSQAPNNWDAAWVFVKYRIKAANGGDDLWKHALLNDAGHSTGTGTPAAIDAGLQTPGDAFNATTNPGLGVFIFRSADGSGTFSATGIQLRWNYGANGVPDNAMVDVQVFAIEMVYVPQGAFKVGTTAMESGSFTDGSWTSGNTIPLSISSENALTIAQSAGNLWGTSSGGPNTIGVAGTLATSFPKGYSGFYCQKYEITQQQYVDFLNTLTSTQAGNRYAASSADFRYGITASGGVYSTTNPYVACNFLIWPDGCAYSDWAGLRPMTELEYEKACRGTATPVGNEFACGIVGSVPAENITNPGAANETTTTSGANVVLGAKTDVQGPMRVGVFAQSGTTRVQSGASYYGIMELSGNVSERAVTVGHSDGRAFTGVHGNGALSANGHANQTAWPGLISGEVTDANGTGLRGSNWGSAVLSSACVSNRLSAVYSINTRQKGHGFRAVRRVAYPNAPAAGTHVPAETQIEWNWNPVAGATGYKWNTTNDYTTATDMATATTKTETGLTCSTAYTRYVWAYNTWGHSTTVTLTQSTSVCPPFICGTSTLSINHVTTGGVAPVDKNTTYGTVTNIPGETAKCWITSNLGSTQQATSVSDASEASAGWYWQFNRKQGYMHDGSNITPSWTVTSINENSDWQTANDPCAIELGTGWRLPTKTEWSNVDGTGGWTDWNGPWNSGLKLHAAGILYSSNGSLIGRGFGGYYWSSTQDNMNEGSYLLFGAGGSSMISNGKALGSSVRCLRDYLPVVSTTSVTGITETTASTGGDVTVEGMSAVTARGVCYGTSTAPTTAGSKTSDGPGTGAFTSSLTNLAPGTLYYVRAYATNSQGTAYGNEVNFTTVSSFTCGTTLSINHVTTGGVAPVNKSTTYNTVNNIPGAPTKCWITKNLGATQQATAVNDATEASAGWYWQFNRKQGYKHDGSTITPSWTVTSINENSDWQTANDPCAIELGTGWRLPTKTEWENVDATSGGNWTDWNGPWNSGLKLHAAGYLSYSDGRLYERGSAGYYRSSMQYSTNNSYILFFDSGNSLMDYNFKADGYSARCLRD